MNETRFEANKHYNGEDLIKAMGATHEEIRELGKKYGGIETKSKMIEAIYNDTDYSLASRLMTIFYVGAFAQVKKDVEGYDPEDDLKKLLQEFSKKTGAKVVMQKRSVGSGEDLLEMLKADKEPKSEKLPDLKKIKLLIDALEALKNAIEE